MPRKVLVTVTMLLAAAAARGSTTVGAQHVTSGFDDLTNGYVTQEEFDAARLKFEEIETAADGLGPMYNAPSCAACHASPVTGGAGQISEVRAGHLDATGRFVPAAGGSLIRDRAILPAIQAHVSDVDDIRGLRITSPVLGLGYIEAIDDSTFIELAAKQAAATDGRIAGQIVTVPCSRPTASGASADSAGRTNTQVFFRLLEMPISMRWGSQIGWRRSKSRRRLRRQARMTPRQIPKMRRTGRSAAKTSTRSRRSFAPRKHPRAT